MKNKISKLFFYTLIFLGAVVSSAKLQAQNVQGPSRLGEPSAEQEWQVRLYALHLCKYFYASVLSEDFASKLESYIASIESKTDGLPAYVPGQIENYVETHRTSSNLAMRYIKCQAIVAFPEGFNDMSPQALADVQAELDAIALEISGIKN